MKFMENKFKKIIPQNTKKKEIIIMMNRIKSLMTLIIYEINLKKDNQKNHKMICFIVNQKIENFFYLRVWIMNKKNCYKKVKETKLNKCLKKIKDYLIIKIQIINLKI